MLIAETSSHGATEVSERQDFLFLLQRSSLQPETLHCFYNWAI